MPLNHNYSTIPFSSDVSKVEFYTYIDVRRLAMQKNMENIINCRTIGILESTNGVLYLKDIDLVTCKPDTAFIQVSLMYLEDPLPCTVIPQTIQVFGALGWEKCPVLYANMIQLLYTPMALRLKRAMDNIASKHLAPIERRKRNQDKNECS